MSDLQHETVVKCLKCGSDSYSRAGIVWGRQRYKCKNCNYFFSRLTVRGKEQSVKEMAAKMYLEGLGFRAIGRLLEVSHVSVYRWIRARGERLFLKEATREV